jgi:hypothetical protein
MHATDFIRFRVRTADWMTWEFLYCLRNTVPTSVDMALRNTVPTSVDMALRNIVHVICLVKWPDNGGV